MINTLPSLSSHNHGCCRAEYSSPSPGYGPSSSFSPSSGSGSTSISGSGSETESARSALAHECPFQSAHHWESKCGEDFNFAETVRHNRESRDPQGWLVGSPLGTCSLPMALSISWSIWVKLGPRSPTIEVGWSYFCQRHPADSVAATTLRIDSSSGTKGDMFSMTPADLRPAVRTS